MGLLDRLFAPMGQRTDWPSIGETWAEQYPSLTAIGIRPWDYQDMADLDRRIGEAISRASEPCEESPEKPATFYMRDGAVITGVLRQPGIAGPPHYHIENAEGFHTIYQDAIQRIVWHKPTMPATD